MAREGEITSYEDLREIAALRHSFHIDSRLRLEFLSVVSRLLREHEVPVSNRVLSTLILAVPDELPDGNGHQENGYNAQLAVETAAKSRLQKNMMPIEPIPPIPPRAPIAPTVPIPPTVPKAPTVPIPPVPPRGRKG